MIRPISLCARISKYNLFWADSIKVLPVPCWGRQADLSWSLWGQEGVGLLHASFHAQERPHMPFSFRHYLPYLYPKLSIHSPESDLYTVIMIILLSSYSFVAACHKNGVKNAKGWLQLTKEQKLTYSFIDFFHKIFSILIYHTLCICFKCTHGCVVPPLFQITMLVKHSS